MRADGIGGQHGQHGLPVETAFAKLHEFALGRVVGHVTHICPEEEGAAELMELLDLGADGIHVVRIGGHGGSEHFEGGNHGHVFARWPR